MSRILWRLLPLAGVLSLTAGSQENVGTVFHADTRVVVCNTTVTDKSGHFVTDLAQSAFSVFEDGVRQQIRVFKREDLPVSLGLIIDNSGSMRPRRASVEAAALALVKDSNPQDEVFIVNFNDTAYLDNPHGKAFTSDIEEMKEALTRIDSRGGTAMRDAVQMSLDHLKANAHKEKKVLVMVTDGVENSSTISRSLEELVRNARQSGVLIYSVGLLTEEEKRDAAAAKRQLNALAEATGGETFYPKDVSEVDKIAHQVARDIRSQYTIAYSPSNANMDGTYRRIKVTVRAPGSPTPRTRTGYFASPDKGK
ncbi:MAG: VWA domain-containing protein [Bryobacteraceae bacterium]|jgi:VWFA-related protein